MELNKVVRLGSAKTYGGRSYSIFCRIELKEGKLSITGVEGPLASGNALGGCGQINMHLREHLGDINPLAPGWTRPKLTRFFEVWEKWHLNDMKAGTPEQMAELAKHKYPGYSSGSHYDWACGILKVAGLYEVPIGPMVPNANGAMVQPTYKYGHAWLREEVPAEVIEFLASLPDTDIQPAWV